ncbi:MAG TPA: oxygenase MpaB family protein [Allosphingosinicella sp.]
MGGPAIMLPTLREAIASMEAVIAGSVGSVSVEDTGLFGPGSVSWRICREPAYAVSAIAGLLMGALHPVAMAAIDQHSDYRRDAWRRAHRTTQYVFTITFGSTPVALSAAERVRRIHDRVAGTDPVTARSYRAGDADLLLWIHCVNTEMALTGQQAFGRPLTSAEQDRYVAEQVKAAALAGLEPARVPASRAELERCLAQDRPLKLTPAAGEFARLLLEAEMPWTMRPFWALHVAGALMILPERVRELYGFSSRLPKGRLARWAVRAVLRTMDVAYAAFPPIRRARRHLRRVGAPARS